MGKKPEAEDQAKACEEGGRLEELNVERKLP